MLALPVVCNSLGIVFRLKKNSVREFQRLSSRIILKIKMFSGFLFVIHRVFVRDTPNRNVRDTPSLFTGPVLSYPHKMFAIHRVDVCDTPNRVQNEKYAHNTNRIVPSFRL